MKMANSPEKRSSEEESERLSQSSQSTSPAVSVQDEGETVMGDEGNPNVVDRMQSLSVTKSLTESIDKEAPVLTESEENQIIKKTVQMLPERIAPSNEVPEKIIFVVDRASDSQDEQLPFEMLNGKKYSCFTMIKRIITMFVYNKALINKEHKFALMFYNDSDVKWGLDFQNSPTAVTKALDVDSCNHNGLFDITKVFKLLSEKVTLLPNNREALINPPPYVTRVILIYMRSDCVAYLDKTKDIQAMLDSPYFYFDVLLSYNSTDCNGKSNFTFLNDKDKIDGSHSYVVTRSCKELHEAAAKLLAHPLQRPKQEDANYNVPQYEE